MIAEKWTLPVQKSTISCMNTEPILIEIFTDFV